MILFTEGVPGQEPPPRDQVHPPPPGPGTSPTPGTRYTLTPGTRYTPLEPGTPPWNQVHPLSPTPPGTKFTPLGPGTPPGTRYTPLGPGRPPRTRYSPQSSACWEIRATSGQYASYWNAFLFGIIFAENCIKMKKNWTELGSVTSPPGSATCYSLNDSSHPE